MKITTIEARDLGDAWWQLLRECVLGDTYEYTITHGSHNEGWLRREFDLAVVHITNPGARPLAPIVPPEVAPPTSEEYIEAYLPYLLSSEKQTNEVYTYGEYLEPQYNKVIDMYNEFGEYTNQACMNVGDKESIDLVDPPCLRVVDTRVRYGKLHWFVYFRSWDLWGGFPTNMGGIQLAKEMMAKEIGVEDGELFAFSKGLHLYGETLDLAKMTLKLEA